MITEAIVLSAPRVSVEVDEDVRTGRLAVHLLRPLSYTLFLMAKTLGERAVRFAMNIVSGSIVALVLVGPIPLSLSGLGMFAFILPAAFVLDFLAYLFIGLFAFWLESTVGLWILYSRLTMLLGGMLMPIEIFPERLQPILRNLPFAMMVYGPARIFVAPNARTLWSIAVTQAWGLAAFSIAVCVIQHIALKRIQSNGG
jgi:ABC-2 type transport system permease protein